MSQTTQTSVQPSGKGPARTAGPGRGWLLLGAAVVVLGGAAAGGWYLIGRRHERASARAQPASDPAPAGPLVATTRLAPGGIVRTSAQIGSVQAYEEADLYAKVSGYLKELRVDYGSVVKQGELLAVIDDPEAIKDREAAQAAVAQAQAVKAQAQARIASTKADLKAAEAAVAQADAEVRRAVAKRSFRAKVLARYKDLVARNAETQQVVDEQEENYESAVADELAAQAAEATARAQAAAAQAKVDLAVADLAEAEANVRVDEAALARAQVIEGYTRIESPYDGVVTRRNYFRGAFIRSAAEEQSPPVLSVARTDKVRVVTYVPDLAVPLTDVGDPAEVTLDALPGKVLKGTVSRFASTEDLTSRTMHTEIDLDNPNNLVRPGMSGIARIILDTDTKRSTLPAGCLVGGTHGDRADVFVVKDGKARKTQVRIGADDGLRVEIVDGLSENDQVIVDTNSVADGMPVRVAGTEKPAPAEKGARP